jgi:hypothetical protein
VACLGRLEVAVADADAVQVLESLPEAKGHLELLLLRTHMQQPRREVPASMPRSMQPAGMALVTYGTIMMLYRSCDAQGRAAAEG